MLHGTIFQINYVKRLNYREGVAVAMDSSVID